MTPSVFSSFFIPSRKCTELVSSVIVPVLVIVPPVNPSPATIDVTVPAPPGAQLADTAQLLVPYNDPVIPCVTFSDPVTKMDPVTVNDPVMSSPSGNVTPPDTYDAVSAVVANDADSTLPNNRLAVAAVVANDADSTLPNNRLAVAAYDALVMLPRTFCATVA